MKSANKNQFLHRRSANHLPNNYWAIHVTIQNGVNNYEISTGVESRLNDLKKSRSFRISGVPVTSSEISSYITLNWLTPQMDIIISGPESGRRKFFDRMIISFDSSHIGRLKKFEKLARERSKLIEKNYQDKSWLNIIERKMAETGVAVIAARINMASLLDKIMANPTVDIFPPVRILWGGQVEEWMSMGPALDAEDKMTNHLKTHRETYNINLCGPTQSILNIWHGKTGMTAEFCSTGQQKSILVSMVLAYSKLLSDFKKLPPIMLLDEVSAHLDEYHFQALFDASIGYSGQIWMTGNDLKTFKKLKSGKELQYFAINDSIITQLIDL